MIIQRRVLQFLDTVETPVVVQRQVLGFDSAENCGDSAVAARRIFGPGRRHLCRGAEADSHGPVQETIEILQLLYIDKVVDVLVVPVQFRLQAWRRQPSSHNCSCRALDKVVDTPVVCNDQCPWCS